MQLECPQFTSPPNEIARSEVAVKITDVSSARCQESSSFSYWEIEHLGLHATDFLRCTNGDITAFIEYLITVYKIGTVLKLTLKLMRN
jgi:hypothetical protein